jgi:ankyrin repeat protein
LGVLLVAAGLGGLSSEEDDSASKEGGEVLAVAKTAIFNAAYMGDAEAVKIILAAGPDPDARDGFGATALHDAIFRANLEVMGLLLEYGFDVNAVVPSLGYTPLHYTVWLNRPEAVPLLLKYNADKEIKNNDGQTPLQMATKQGRREVIIALSRK